VRTKLTSQMGKLLMTVSYALNATNQPDGGAEFVVSLPALAAQA